MRDYPIRAIGTAQVALPQGDAILWTVNINTGAGAAILNIYDGTTNGDRKVAAIDASTKSSHCYGFMLRKGIFIELTGGNADCTIGWS